MKYLFFAYLGISDVLLKFLERFRKSLFIFHFFVSLIFDDQMTGPNEENERQPKAATSSTSSIPPVDTDEWIHQQMVRLTPDEVVVHRPRPGKLLNFTDFRYNFVVTTLFSLK